MMLGSIGSQLGGAKSQLGCVAVLSAVVHEPPPPEDVAVEQPRRFVRQIYIGHGRLKLSKFRLRGTAHVTSAPIAATGIGELSSFVAQIRAQVQPASYVAHSAMVLERVQAHGHAQFVMPTKAKPKPVNRSEDDDLLVWYVETLLK